MTRQVLRRPWKKTGARMPVRIRSFQDLNLSRNPFGEPSLAARVDLAVARPIPAPRGRVVQLVAPQGRGKSTVLLAQLRFLREAVYWRAGGESDRPRPASEDSVLLLDEADALSSRALRRVVRPWARVIAATHVDLSRRLGRPTDTIALPPLDLESFRTYLARRMEWARLGPGPIPRFADAFVVELWRQYGGNLRLLEHALYETFQSLRVRVPAGTEEPGQPLVLTRLLR